MLSKVAATVVVVLTCGVVARAAAQTTAQGQAYGANVSLGGTLVIDASNTGVGNAGPAPTPRFFDKSASGATIPADPLINVITGPSRTRGCADAAGCPELFPPAAPADTTELPSELSDEIFVRSRAGDSAAAVLVGQAPGPADVLDVSASNSNLTVRCNNATGKLEQSLDSEVDALVIGGTAVPVPGPVAPNTTILAPEFQLIVLNEQDCHAIPVGNPAPTGVTCSVNALHVRGAPDPPATGGQVVEAIFSHAEGTLNNAPCICGPIFTNSKKFAEVLNPDGSHKDSEIPSPGDKIRYTVAAINTGCLPATGLVVVDRIPNGVTFDQGSTQIQTCPASTPQCNATATPIAGTIANCSSSQSFTGCSGEATNDASRQCLTVSNGDVPADTSKNIIFTVTVNGGDDPGGCNEGGFGDPTCNTALIFTNETAPEGTQAGSVTNVCPNGPCASVADCPPLPTRTPTRTPTSGGPVGTPTPTPPGGAGGTATPAGGGTPKPDFLVTTGSGGCALGASSRAGGSEILPVLFAGIWLGLRQWRKRRSGR